MKYIKVSALYIMNRTTQAKETGKRKRSVTSIIDKIAAINSIDNGASASAIAMKMGVDPSTIRRWISKRKHE